MCNFYSSHIKHIRIYQTILLFFRLIIFETCNIDQDYFISATMDMANMIMAIPLQVHIRSNQSYQKVFSDILLFLDGERHKNISIIITRNLLIFISFYRYKSCQ